MMVSHPFVRRRLAPTVWRMFYDVGKLVVLEDSASGSVSRILGFPTTPELCERFCGIWEGIGTTSTQRARARETSCTRRGDAHCEISVEFEPRT